MTLIIPRVILYICILFLLYAASRDLKTTIIFYSLGYWTMTILGVIKNGL